MEMHKKSAKEELAHAMLTFNAGTIEDVTSCKRRRCCCAPLAFYVCLQTWRVGYRLWFHAAREQLGMQRLLRTICSRDYAKDAVDP